VLRDFYPAYVRSGMVQPCSGPRQRAKLAGGAKAKEHAMSHKLNSRRANAPNGVRRMSALHPIASAFTQRRELTLCARTGLMHRSIFDHLGTGRLLQCDHGCAFS